MNQSVLLFLLVTFSFHPKKGTTLASPTGNLPGKYSNRVVALGQGFFQILMWHGVLFFSVLLRRCGLVLASHLGDPSLFILQERLEQLQLYVLTPPSGRTRRLATGEPVNIPADFDLDSLYVEVLRALCSQMSLPTSGTRSRSSNGSKK